MLVNGFWDCVLEEGRGIEICFVYAYKKEGGYLEGVIYGTQAEEMLCILM